MKLLLVGLLTLASVSAFSKTCVVTRAATDSSNFDQQIAIYTNVDDQGENFITLIKPNGDVVENFDTAEYYQGVTSQAEIDERTAAIAGSELAIISIDKENNQLTLSTGDVVKDSQEILKATVMSLSDLDSSKSAVFDMKKKLAIYCVE